jgi:ankyrin repeat protein
LHKFFKYLSEIASAPTMPQVNALEAAIRVGDTQAVLKELHYQQGLVDDNQWDDALRYAVFCEQFGVFEVLLAEVDRVSPDIFIIASEIGSGEFVHALLNHGVNINCAITNGTTGMMAAAGVASGLFEFADEVNPILVGEKNDYISPKTSYSLSTVSQSRAFKAYHKHIHAGCTAVLEILVSKGADANLSNQNGDTALLGAASCGSMEAVNLSLSAGADVNTFNRYGFSPLIIATIKGYTEIARLLLEYGANTTHKDNDGFTASMRALQHGETDLVELLSSKNS